MSFAGASGLRSPRPPLRRMTHVTLIAQGSARYDPNDVVISNSYIQLSTNEDATIAYPG